MRISDWSSDVCSSDLKRARDWVFLGADPTPHAQAAVTVAVHQNANTPPALYAVDNRTGLEQMILDLNPRLRTDFSLGRVEFVHWKDQEGGTWEEIGRAACRERVCQ